MNGSLLSDLDLARLEHPGYDDADLVRTLARETVRELELVAPVDPGMVASFRGISRIEEVDQPWAGCLTHDGEETVARLRRSDNRRRKRFTAFHEIKHTYLPGYTVTQYRCDPSAAPLPRQRSLEQLADIGASELLFPADEFRADLDGNRLGLDLVEALSEEYDASLAATAFRAVELIRTDALLICVEPATKPSDPHGEPRLRVKWSSATGNWPYIPRHKSFPEGSAPHRALEGELVDELGHLEGLTHSPIEHVDISCRLYPYVDHDGQPRDRVLYLATRA